MIRKCAWCTCYLNGVQSGTNVTHGICERCAERVLNSVSPRMEEIQPATQACAKIVGTEFSHAA